MPFSHILGSKGDGREGLVHVVPEEDWQPLPSLSRGNQQSFSFNTNNDEAFFRNLRTVLDRHQFQAKDFWNMDETSTCTEMNRTNIKLNANYDLKS